jgi:hypothetical protein
MLCEEQASSARLSTDLIRNLDAPEGNYGLKSMHVRRYLAAPLE